MHYFCPSSPYPASGLFSLAQQLDVNPAGMLTGLQTVSLGLGAIALAKQSWHGAAKAACAVGGAVLAISAEQIYHYATNASAEPAWQELASVGGFIATAATVGLVLKKRFQQPAPVQPATPKQQPNPQVNAEVQKLQQELAQLRTDNDEMKTNTKQAQGIILDLNRKLTTLSQELTDISKDEDKAKIIKLQADLDAKILELATLDKKHSQCAGRIAELENALKIAETSIQREKTDKESARKANRELTTRIKEVNKTAEDAILLQREIDRLGNENKRLQGELNKVEGKHTTLSTELTKAEQALRFGKEEREKMNQEKADFESKHMAEIDRLKLQVTELTAQVNKHVASLSESESIRQGLTTMLISTQAKEVTARQNADELAEKNQELQQKLAEVERISSLGHAIIGSGQSLSNASLWSTAASSSATTTSSTSQFPSYFSMQTAPQLAQSNLSGSVNMTEIDMAEIDASINEMNEKLKEICPPETLGTNQKEISGIFVPEIGLIQLGIEELQKRAGSLRGSLIAPSGVSAQDTLNASVSMNNSLLEGVKNMEEQVKSIKKDKPTNPFLELLEGHLGRMKTKLESSLSSSSYFAGVDDYSATHQQGTVAPAADRISGVGVLGLMAQAMEEKEKSTPPKTPPSSDVDSSVPPTVDDSQIF